MGMFHRPWATTLDEYEKTGHGAAYNPEGLRGSIFHTVTLSNAPEFQIRVTSAFAFFAALTVAWRKPSGSFGNHPPSTLCSGLTLPHLRYHLWALHLCRSHRCAEHCWPRPLTAPGTMRTALIRCVPILGICCICLASCTSCSTLELMYKDAEVSISHWNQQNSKTSIPSLIYSIGSCASGSFQISKCTKVNKR